MELTLNATKPPVLLVVPNSANFTITGAVDVRVIQPPNDTIVTAFVLGVVRHYSSVTVADILWYSAAGYVHVYIGAIKLNSYSRHKCVVAVSFVTHPLVLFPLHSHSSPLQLPDSSFSLYISIITFTVVSTTFDVFV